MTSPKRHVFIRLLLILKYHLEEMVYPLRSALTDALKRASILEARGSLIRIT